MKYYMYECALGAHELKRALAFYFTITIFCFLSNWLVAAAAAAVTVDLCFTQHMLAYRPLGSYYGPDFNVYVETVVQL